MAILRPELPMLLDSGSVIGSVADPAAALEGSKYGGRVFYLRRADWANTRYPDVISRSEADSYKRHGKAIVLNFEDTAANWCLGGYDVGRNRGEVAARELVAIGCESAPVYMSIDFRPSGAGQMNAVMECLRGFQDSALGKRGRAVYGFAPTIREAKRRNLADYFWLCGDGRELYPGGADVDLMGTVNIWQQNNEQPYFAGVQIDDNYVYTTDFGQWRPDSTEEAPVPELTPSQDVQIQLRGENLKGWAARLYHLAKDAQPKLSLVDFVREMHAKTNSRLTRLTPVPMSEPDDHFGTSLSIRADLARVEGKIDQLLARGK